jgi:hypothetical protein
MWEVPPDHPLAVEYLPYAIPLPPERAHYAHYRPASERPAGGADDRRP